MSTRDITLDTTELTNVTGTELDVQGNSVDSTLLCEPTDGLTLEASKKEYSIVGDALYASVSADDAPQWLLSVIDSVIGIQLANGLSSLSEAKNSIFASLAELDIAKNEYTELINIDATIDSVIASHVTALNAAILGNSGDIASLELVKVTEDQVLTTVAERIAASLSTGGSVRSEIDRLDVAFVSLDEAYSISMDTLYSVLNTQQGETVALANAQQSLQTYVGIDGAGASSGTGLSAYLEGSDGVVGSATSDVINGVYLDGVTAKSKWEYESALTIDGVYHTSGFGLNLQTIVGTGTELDPYDSEFWINAEKFKFTNSAQSGQTAPFTIDASGVTPQVTFNGVVDFTNTNTSGTTTIDGAKITTGSIDANRITAGTLSVGNIDMVDGAITNAKISGPIQSNNYVAGSAGWQIHEDGSAEFHNGQFRGTVYAAKISGDVTKVVNINTNPSTNVTTTWATTANIAAPDNGHPDGRYISASMSLSGYRTEGSYLDLHARMYINGTLVSSLSNSGNVRSAVTLSGGFPTRVIGAAYVLVQVYSGTANDGVIGGVSGFVMATG